MCCGGGSSTGPSKARRSPPRRWAGCCWSGCSYGFYFGMGLFALAGAVLVVCVGLALMGRHHRHEVIYLWVAAVVSACVAGIGAIIAAYGRSGWLRFHEHGVVQTLLLGGERRLMYPEIGEVTWKSSEVLILRPRRPGPGIRFRTVAGKLDSELAGMRDLACRHLAEKWGERVPAGPLVWTPKLRFLPGGLEYRPTGLLLPPDPVCVPYQLTSYRIEGDSFLLFVNDQKRPACKERLDVPNFFVGLVLLNRIYQQAKAASPFATPEAAAPRPRSEAPADHRISGRMKDEGRPDAEV